MPEARAQPPAALDDTAILFNLDVQPLALLRWVRFLGGARGVNAGGRRSGLQMLAPACGLVKRGLDQRQQIGRLVQSTFPEHGHGPEAGDPIQQFAPPGSGEKRPRGSLLRGQDVELQEVVGQAIIKDSVLGVEPFPVDNDTGPEHRHQSVGVGGGPSLAEIPMALAWSAGQVVAPALQKGSAIGPQAQPGVGAVKLLFDDHVPSPQRVQRHSGKIFIAGLQARPFQMWRARVLADGVRRARCHPHTATPTRWPGTYVNEIRRAPAETNIDSSCSLGQQVEVLRVLVRRDGTLRTTADRPPAPLQPACRFGSRHVLQHFQKRDHIKRRCREANRGRVHARTIELRPASAPHLRQLFHATWININGVTETSDIVSRSGQRKAPRPEPTSRMRDGAKPRKAPSARCTRGKSAVLLKRCSRKPAAKAAAIAASSVKSGRARAPRA